MSIILKTTKFTALQQDVSEKKYTERFRLNVWESKYLSSNIQVFLESLINLLRKELDLMDTKLVTNT